MRKPYLIPVAVAVVLIFITLAVLFSTGSGSSGPKITVHYLTQTNYAGYTTAYFAVTNTGDVSVVTWGQGRVTVDGQPGRLLVAFLSSHQLSPGQGAIIQVTPPRILAERWQFTPYYAHVGLRSRIYDFQWGLHGPGSHMNWLIPRPLKGVVLDVTATSDWVNVTAPTNFAPASATK